MGSNEEKDNTNLTLRSRSVEKSPVSPVTLDSIGQLLKEMEARLTANQTKATNTTNDKISKVAKGIKDLEKIHTQRFEALEQRVNNQEETSSKLQEDFLAMKNEIATLKAELQEAKVANDSTGSAELTTVKEELENLRQYSRNRNLVIDGVPPTTGENLKSLFINMGQCMEISIDPKEIEAIHRLPAKPGSNRAPSILVQVKSRPLRDNFIIEAKKKKFTLPTLGYSSGTGNVFVSEHLTKFRSKLYYEARMVKRNYGFKYVWVKNGMVFLKKDDSSPSVLINSMAVIDRLKS